MKYICNAAWRDLTDGHMYCAGDAFPHDGREISGERLAELSGTQNKAGFALITAVEEPVMKPAEEKPVEKKEPVRKSVKSRKK